MTYYNYSMNRKPAYSHTGQYPASPRQIAFINDLISARDGKVSEIDQAKIEAIKTIDFTSALGGNRATSSIDTLKAIRPAAVALENQPEVGVYKIEDDTLVRIKWNQAHTNRYAMKAAITVSERLTELDETVHFDFTYAPELRKLCNEGNKVTVSEALAFGIKHGNCMCCGRVLSVKKSVQQGIGPVCIKYFKA